MTYANDVAREGGQGLMEELDATQIDMVAGGPLPVVIIAAAATIAFWNGAYQLGENVGETIANME